jgi:transposase
MAHSPTTQHYPSDLNDAEWTLLDPLIPKARKAGRPEKYAKRAILNAIFYLVRSGRAWRMLPRDLPPWKLVWHYFARWKKLGVWAQLNDALRDAVRLQAGKKSPDRCDPRRAKRAHD